MLFAYIVRRQADPTGQQ